MIYLDKINKIYINKNHVLKDVSLGFDNTEFVGILGPSGSGKTTLLNIIGGLDIYTSGDILVNGVSTSCFKEVEWDNYRGNSVGFIFQGYNLIEDLTVYDNIKLANSLNKKEINEEKIDEILTKVDMINYKKTRVSLLSGGEQQRVAIARALAKDPEVILADEPTGALDSTNSEIIINILKDIAKTKLVIMVSHNEKLVNTYCDRIIKMNDGKVIFDSSTSTIDKKKENNKLKRKKTSLSLKQSINMCFKTLTTRPIRALLTILSGCVGVLGVSLVLMFSSIVDNYIVDLQKSTLSNSPITIRSQVDNTDPYKEDVDYELYPDTRYINVTNQYISYYNHINKFDNNFIKYINELDKSLYNFMDYKTNVNINLLTIMNGSYKRVYTSKFTEISDDLEYIKNSYDVLDGDFPNDINEIAILVDRYNNIDISVLDSLGIDYKDIEKYTFDEIKEKEYKVILNDDIYKKDVSGLYRNYFSTVNYETLYNKSELTLKITGIIRVKKNASTNLYDNGILYTRKLSNYILENSNKSNIVIEQRQYGLDKNVLTGEPFEDDFSLYLTQTKEYQYQYLLQTLSAETQISSIRIYTDQFRNRLIINKYLEDYNIGKDSNNMVLYSDYMGDITREFDAFITILTNILIVFAAISLFVSTIMISIITYVSVVQRTREIGILRSLGSRRFDISIMINTETGILGLISGVIGVVSGVLLLQPIINVITNILKNNNVTTFDLTLLDLNKFSIASLIIIVIGNVILMVIGGLIPSIVAANKKPVEAIKGL